MSLCLTVKKGESIFIDKTIKVTSTQGLSKTNRLIITDKFKKEVIREDLVEYTPKDQCLGCEEIPTREEIRIDELTDRGFIYKCMLCETVNEYFRKE